MRPADVGHLGAVAHVALEASVLTLRTEPGDHLLEALTLVMRVYLFFLPRMDQNPSFDIKCGNR